MINKGGGGGHRGQLARSSIDPCHDVWALVIGQTLSVVVKCIDYMDVRRFAVTELDVWFPETTGCVKRVVSALHLNALICHAWVPTVLPQPRRRILHKGAMWNMRTAFQEENTRKEVLVNNTSIECFDSLFF